MHVHGGLEIKTNQTDDSRTQRQQLTAYQYLYSSPKKVHGTHVYSTWKRKFDKGILKFWQNHEEPYTYYRLNKDYRNSKHASMEHFKLPIYTTNINCSVL